MKITGKEVRYVADLANLALSEAEVEAMVHDLDEILEHAAKLNEIDTDGVEPMAQVLAAGGTANLREDTIVPPLSNADATANAAQKGAGCFKVPLVIER